MPAVRLWAFGVGFYNLFLACGVVAGVIAWGAGDEAVGRALVIYVCLSWLLSGIVLLIDCLYATRRFARSPSTGVAGLCGRAERWVSWERDRGAVCRRYRTLK